GHPDPGAPLPVVAVALMATVGPRAAAQRERERQDRNLGAFVEIASPGEVALALLPRGDLVAGTADLDVVVLDAAVLVDELERVAVRRIRRERDLAVLPVIGHDEHIGVARSLTRLEAHAVEEEGAVRHVAR